MDAEHTVLLQWGRSVPPKDWEGIKSSDDGRWHQLLG